MLSIITVRTESDRFPHKVVAPITDHNGYTRPLLVWMAYRLKAVSDVIIATTKKSSDNIVAKVGQEIGVPVFRGEEHDVVKRVHDAHKHLGVTYKYVFRALGDCPFIEGEFLTRAHYVLKQNNAEAFLWALAPDVFPVYGAREFPISTSALTKIHDNAKGAEEREHVDMWFHKHRERFTRVYHIAPGLDYFRPYRLEIDYEEDLELVKAVARTLGMLAPLREVIKFLDGQPAIAAINRDRIEKTGMQATTYDYATRRSWMAAFRGHSVVSWDNNAWRPTSDKATPQYCSANQCLIGWYSQGQLYRLNGDIVEGKAFISCECGSGREWRKKYG